MIILVDENDVQKGIMGKMEVHKQGLLHRAFSVFIVNDNNELLIVGRTSSPIKNDPEMDISFVLRFDV